MTDKLLRSLKMLQLVPRAPRKAETAKIRDTLLENGFDVSMRTIQRDLIKLSSIFPLVSDERNKPFGWSWRGNDSVGFPAIDLPSALASLMTEKFLTDVLPSSVLKKLEPNFQQARNVLKETSSGLGKWENKVRIIPRGLQLLPAEVKPGIMDTVYESLLLEKRFEAKYQPRNAKDLSEYEVSPLGIVNRNNVSYLVCTLWDYPDVKQMALHRFKSVSETDKGVVVPQGFDLDDYIEGGGFSYSESDKKIRLKLIFSEEAGRHLYENPLSEDQVIDVAKDGRVLVKATVLDADELRWWILGFGGLVEVVSPKKLRNDIIDSLSSALQRYQG